MNSKLKTNTLIFLVLLAALAIAAVSQNANVARAQSDVATVIVMPTAGGTTTLLQENIRIQTVQLSPFKQFPTLDTCSVIG